MNEWKEYVIEDFGELVNQKRIPLSSMERSKRKGNYPYYGASGIIDYVDDYIFEGEHVLISEDGENLRSRQTPISFIANGKFWVNNHAHIFKGLRPIYNRLVVYYFANLDLNPYLTGAVQPKLNKATLSTIPLVLPSSDKEHSAIVSVLSSLDDKIDLLHRQNATLEKLAETLFRQWFVVESKEEWENGKLGDIILSIESGTRPKGGIDPELKHGVPSIGAESIKGIGAYDYAKTKFVTEEFFKTMNRGIINDFDVLIYKDGAYIGRKGMFGKGFPFKLCTVNEHVFILRSNERANQFFLYFLLQENELAQLNANSAQPGLNQESMKSFEILIPPIEKIKKFENIVKPWVEKILFNSKQILNLTTLRDSLLPKLMSGEATVEIN